MKNAKVFYMCFTDAQTLVLASEVEKGLSYQHSADLFIPVELAKNNPDLPEFSDDYDFKVLHKGQEIVWKLKKTTLSALQKTAENADNLASLSLPIYAVETPVGKFLFKPSTWLALYNGMYNSIKSLKNRRFARLIPLQGVQHLERAFKEHRLLFMGTANSD